MSVVDAGSRVEAGTELPLAKEILARWRTQRAGAALLAAIAAGDPSRVRDLIPNSDVHFAEALKAAALAGQPEIMRLLLAAAQQGALPERRRGVSAHRLHSDRLHAYATTVRLAAYIPDGDALLAAVEAVTLARVRDALAADPRLVSARNWLGWTLLHTAAMTANVRAVRLLLDAGSDVNARDRQEHTPLAAVANRLPAPGVDSPDDGCVVAEQLIAAGADVRSRSGPEQQTPLHIAARRGNVALAALLLDHGAEIEARTTLGETPLRRAVNTDHVAFAALLIARGASPHTPDRKGKTPLDAARSAAMRAALAG